MKLFPFNLQFVLKYKALILFQRVADWLDYLFSGRRRTCAHFYHAQKHLESWKSVCQVEQDAQNDVNYNPVTMLFKKNLLNERKPELLIIELVDKNAKTTI